jgi:hypothetical protein
MWRDAVLTGSMAHLQGCWRRMLDITMDLRVCLVADWASLEDLKSFELLGLYFTEAR